MSIKLASLNVRGLANKNKREKILCWLKDQSITITLLQETHSATQSNAKWEQEWGTNYAFFSGESSNSKGVAILVDNASNVNIMSYIEIIKGRLQAIEIKINDSCVTIINVYGPNQDETNIFNKLKEYVDNNNDKTFIIGGDFNTVLNEDIDKKNGSKHTHIKKRRTLQDIIQTHNLVDIWRIQNPDKHQFTWHSNSRPTVFCRLDYFLISDNLTNFVSQNNIKPGYNTDHSLIRLDLDYIKIDRGPGVFKLNNSILFESDYQEIIRKSIGEIVNLNKNANANTLWELIKGNIRNETIKYTAYKAKLNRELENKLKTQIKELEDKLAKATDKTIIEDIQQSLKEKNEINNGIIEDKIKGILVRSKANQIEFDEKNSKYFSNLEKKKAEQKLITKLNIKGNICKNQEEIRQEQFRFYKTLYAKKESQTSDINFFNPKIEKLTEIHKDKCEGPLSEYECLLALKDMKNSKSPGSDGLTTEFYKIFWKDLKHHFIRSINYSFENKCLTDLQKQGLITLLPKPEKDVTLIENWRPICLLNIDYKIATKAIANRIKKVLDEIIDSSQTGFIKGRYIGENIRLLSEILQQAEETNTPGILFFSDFEKAFDTLDHNFIFNCLKHFNFGNNLIQWIELFYTNPQNAIINNGHMTDFFRVERGVRQGCPLSPYIFIICLELLSFEIANNENIKGIKLEGEEIRRTLFADDATFCTDGTEKAFYNLIKVLDNFSYVSGLKLNSTKCHVLRIGATKTKDVTYLKNRKFIWKSDEAKALGISFHVYTRRMINQNVEKSVEQFKIVLKSWQHRKLTLLGKITVLKSFALPKLLYVLSTLGLPSKEFIKKNQ